MRLGILASALALTLAFDLVGAALAVAGMPVTMEYADWGFPGFNAVIGLAAVLLGWPIARTRPRNPIGWLLVAIGVLSAFQFAAHYYSVYGIFADPGSLPVPAIGAWLEAWLWVPTVGSATALIPLVFPTGRVLSAGWRWVVRRTLLGMAVASLGFAAQPQLSRADLGPNPIYSGLDASLAGMIIGLGMLLLVGSMILSAASLVVRFRRSRGIERQQLKWLALAAAVTATCFGTYAVLLVVTQRVDNFLTPVVAVSFLGVIIAISIAILRHRLLDIDLLINRALVYAGVTVILGGVYVGAVLLLQPVLSAVAGGGSLAVAASTLAVAALFQPARRRVQSAVDRRFYRSRYDAERVVHRFATTLRDEVDLRTLTQELAGVVERSMHPSRVRIWLRHR